MAKDATETIEKDAIRFLASLRKISKFVHYAQIGQELILLMDSYDSILAFHSEDGEASITAVRNLTNERKVASRKDLLTALQAITGREKRKICMGPCHKEKILSAFSSSKQTADGRNRYCLLCERARVKEASDRRKREAGKKAKEFVEKQRAGEPSTEELPCHKNESQVNVSDAENER